MTYLDDLHAERFGRSLWWTEQPKPEPTPDGEFTTAKRRRDADADAYRHDTKTGAA